MFKQCKLAENKENKSFFFRGEIAIVRSVINFETRERKVIRFFSDKRLQFFSLSLHDDRRRNGKEKKKNPTNYIHFFQRMRRNVGCDADVRNTKISSSMQFYLFVLIA